LMPWSRFFTPSPKSEEFCLSANRVAPFHGRPYLGEMKSRPALCTSFLAFSLVLWAAPCGAQSAEPSDSIPLKQSVPDEAGTDADANDASGEGEPVEGDRSAEAQPAAPEPAAPRTVKVHIESGSRVNLERVTPEGKWVVVCESPCDKELSVEETYRINAKGKVPSSSFRLAER